MILEGIRVIDWTVFQVGPYASALLADLGAEVIHLEPKGRGDLLRGLSPFLGVDVMLQGRHINFEEHNRNKTSLAMDLSKPQSKDIVRRLVERSDVLVTNYRAASRERQGMDYQTLRQYNPKLIYASANGFGAKGPDSESPSVDMLGQARSGAMMTAGEPDGPPVYAVPNVGDRATAIVLAYGVLAALLGRERHGVAQELSTSQLGTMMLLQGYWLMPVLLLGREFPRTGRSKPINALYNFYRCQDDHWIVLCLLGRPGEWDRFCRALERPDLATDAWFADDLTRTQYATELAAILDGVFATRPRAAWEEAFRKYDVLATRINGLSDLPEDPQVVVNDYITDWDHPVLGKIKFPGFLVDFSQTPTTLRSPAPEVGQHNEEILVDVCGYSWDEVGRFRDDGVI